MTRPIATPPIAVRIGTPASMSASEEPQADAIEVDPFDDSVSDTIRIVYGNSSFFGIIGRSARSTSAPCPISRRPAPQRPHLADRERREVVVMHETLRVDRRECVDDLLVSGRPEGHDREHLRLTSLEKGRAVRTREDAHLDRERADLGELAAVRPDPLLDNRSADLLLEEALEPE